MRILRRKGGSPAIQGLLDPPVVFHADQAGAAALFLTTYVHEEDSPQGIVRLNNFPSGGRSTRWLLIVYCHLLNGGGLTYESPGKNALARKDLEIVWSEDPISLT
jgi:hypothetical protein